MWVNSQAAEEPQYERQIIKKYRLKVSSQLVENPEDFRDARRNVGGSGLLLAGAKMRAAPRPCPHLVWPEELGVIVEVPEGSQGMLVVLELDEGVAQGAANHLPALRLPVVHHMTLGRGRGPQGQLLITYREK